MAKRITQADVDASLDNAIQNGYDLEYETAQDIADDLAQYDAGMEGVSTKVLVPLISDWKIRKGAK